MRTPKSLAVSCVVCGEKSRKVPISSPAAPVLSVLEQLESEGWSFQVGFFSMMTGEHNQRCPACTKNKRYPED